MWVQRCKGSERRIVPGGTSEDSEAAFSLDRKTLYFMRPNPSPPKPPVGGRPKEIAAYELATGQVRFLTRIGGGNEAARSVAVSPVPGQIAFFRVRYAPDARGVLQNACVVLAFIQPESGLLRNFTTLPLGKYANSLTWSPAGGDTIFSLSMSAVRGIYRISVTDGAQPLLLFADPTPESLEPGYANYCAGGSRMVWAGQEFGPNSINLRSINANGNDVRQPTNSGGVFMQGILH